MEETQGKKPILKKRNKRGGGVYEHGLITEYESEPSKDKKKEQKIGRINL